MASTTFHILDSAATRVAGKARDDSSINATELAQTQTDYLDCGWEIDEAFVGRTWRLVIACKDTLSQARRKENALWRLWFQRKMGLGKLDPSSINWYVHFCLSFRDPVFDPTIRDKHEDLHLKPLFGPIVLSRQTSTTDLQVPAAVKIPQRGRPLLVSNSSNFQYRGVLRVSSSSPFSQGPRSLSPGSSISYGSSVDSTTIDGPHTPSTSPIRRITFNGYVAQSIIRDDPLPTPEEDSPWPKSAQIHPESAALSRSSSAVKWLDPLPLLTIKPPQPAPPVSPTQKITSTRVYEEPIVVYVLPPGASRQLEESQSRVSLRAAAESDEEPSMRRGRGLARTRSSANLNVEETRGETSPPPRAPSAESDHDRRRPRKKARFSLGA
jgi:Fungal protein of unknown function (DUF1752)